MPKSFELLVDGLTSPDIIAPSTVTIPLANVNRSASLVWPIVALSIEILSTTAFVTALTVPRATASIVPESISTLLISTSPVPLGVIAIFPFAPSVIVIAPVVEFPV